MPPKVNYCFIFPWSSESHQIKFIFRITGPVYLQANNTNKHNQMNAEYHTACGILQGRSLLGVRARPITRRLPEAAVCAKALALHLWEQTKLVGEGR